MSPEEIRSIVTQTLARFETHFRDPGKVLEHVHDDVDWWIAGNTAVSGRSTKDQMFQTLVNLPNFSDMGLRLWPTSFLIDGNRAAVEGEGYMKLKNGIEYTNRYHWYFEFQDGKIRVVHEYLDTARARDVFG